MQFIGAQASKQFVFSHYDLKDGLPAVEINDITQDREGYLWLATVEGLARFDGIRFKTFRHKKGDPRSIPSNALSQVKVDAQNRLWLLGANQKVGIFYPDKQYFEETPLQPEDPALIDAYKGLDVIGEHTFLGIAGKELLVWDEQQRLFRPANEFFPRKPDWSMIGFVNQPGTQKYWGVLRPGAVVVYNRVTGALSYEGDNVENEPLLDELKKFEDVFNPFFDQKNRFWFITWEKGWPHFYCYDLQKRQFLIYGQDILDQVKSYHEIYPFTETSDGVIWIKGANVLGYFDEESRQFVLIKPDHKPNESIYYKTVRAMFEDRARNVWVGTVESGLYRFNPSKTYFSTISYNSKLAERPSDGSPMAFLPDRDGSTLVGVWGEGLYRYDANMNRIPLGIKGFPENFGRPVWDMCYDPDGMHAWFACQPGLYRYNMQTRETAFFEPEEIKGRTIRQIEASKNGNLWLGMQGSAVYKWDAQKGRKRFEDGLAKFDKITVSGVVGNMTIDSKENIWITAGANGLVAIDGKTEEVIWHFHEKAAGFENLPESGVAAVMEYDDSLMLIATSSELFAFNRIAMQTRPLFFNEQINGMIASLKKDLNGNVWMGTTTRLYRIRPHTRSLLSFNREDGIFDDHFTVSAAYCRPDGRMLMGAENHIITFEPDKIKPESALPNVFITDIKTKGDRALPLDSILRLPRIELGPNDNALTISFSPLTFDNWHAIQYKMEGLDEQWRTADDDCQAVYSYFPSGTYRFLTRTIDADLHISPEKAHFTLKIYPPFWKAWWFYSAVALLFGGLFFWFDRERMNRRELVARTRNKIADDLHNEVNTALQHINILSEMANIKAETDLPKSKEFIEQIHQKSRLVSVSMDDMLWGISPENDSMEKITARIRELAAAVNASRSEPVELLIDESIHRLRFDMRLRYEAFLLFKEILIGFSNICTEGFQAHISTERSMLLYTIYCNREISGETRFNNLIQRDDLVKRIDGLGGFWRLHQHKVGFVFEAGIPTRS